MFMEYKPLEATSSLCCKFAVYMYKCGGKNLGDTTLD